jgi:hypothetical protein
MKSYDDFNEVTPETGYINGVEVVYDLKKDGFLLTGPLDCPICKERLIILGAVFDPDLFTAPKGRWDRAIVNLSPNSVLYFPSGLHRDKCREIYETAPL